MQHISHTQPLRYLSAFCLLSMLLSSSAFSQVKISEILFNPHPNGADYLELYNDSDTPQSLSSLRLAQWKGDSIHKLYFIDSSYIIQPFAYCLLTTDPDYVLDSFRVAYPDRIVQLKALPSYNDDSGTVIICDTSQTILDRFDYSTSMHSRLLSNVEGVALERRSFSSPTNDAANWFSASSSSGYGTPTYANSQSREFLFVDNDFTIEPLLFSPDNDGYNDLLNISYQLADPNLTANVSVADRTGRTVRHLLQGGTLGSHGLIIWDGLDDNATRCRQGRYVITVEVYSLDGKRQKTMTAVSLVVND